MQHNIQGKKKTVTKTNLISYYKIINLLKTKQC